MNKPTIQPVLADIHELQIHELMAKKEELNKLGEFWQTGIGEFKDETLNEWQFRVTTYVIMRMKYLDEQLKDLS